MIANLLNIVVCGTCLFLLMHHKCLQGSSAYVVEVTDNNHITKDVPIIRLEKMQKCLEDCSEVDINL